MDTKTMANKLYFVLLAISCLSFGICVQALDEWTITTNECGLTEPIYKHKFDFSSLKSDLAHTATSNRGDIFDFNICRNLTKTCDGQKGVAACMKRNSKEHVLGTQHQLTYRNGKMYFTFTNGSQCKDGTPYQLNVIVGCDYTMDKVQTQVTPYSENACSFYILLETSQACLPAPDVAKSNLCTAKDPETQHVYNLLTLSDSNYRVTDRNGSFFVINVCKPVLYAEAAMCPPGSSICRIDMNASDYNHMFLNYGTVEANPKVENGQLLIRHQSDTVCNSTHNYTSTVYFNCDSSIEYGKPDFMGRRGCDYEFSWITTMACNTIEPCTTFDPISGFKYNMNSLRNETYNLKLDDKTYTIGICADGGSPCLEHAGACESINGQSTSLGNTNSHLRFNQTGSPYLLYETGAPCQPKTKDKTAATTFWSTKIEFVCAASNDGTMQATNDGTSQSAGDAASSSSSGPKIIENSNCQLLIHYQTKLACQNQITCKTRGYGSATSVVTDGYTSSDGHDMDLTPLISTTDNYEAKVSSSISQSEVGKSIKFYLNVCRPLVSKYGLGCPGGSAACMAVMGPKTPEEEQSLGFPDVSLIRINSTSAELKYRRGSPCTKNKSIQLSSTIQFTCDIRAGRGTPVLESIINECHYQFIWPTNVICPAHLCQFDVNTCQIINEQLNERYSMRNASFTDQGKIKIPGTSEFNIDVCGDDHRKALTDYSQSTVKVFFSAPGPCSIDGVVNVELRLVCAAKEYTSSSSDGNHCNLIYTQHTPEICTFLGIDVVKTTQVISPPTVGSPAGAAPSTTTSTSAPSTSLPAAIAAASSEGQKRGSLPTILLVIGIVMATACSLTLLLRTPERRDRLKRLFRKSSSAVRYSRVESNEEANLLLDHNGQFTDSDDDMLL